MTRFDKIAVVAICAAMIGPAYSQSPPSQADRGRAQIEMINRVTAKVRTKALELGLDYDWTGYCQLETSKKAAQFPENSALRYNYNNIQSWDELKSVIAAREVFETQSQILCLHEVRNVIAGRTK